MSARDIHEGIILIADDNELDRELLSTLLSHEGYQVVLVPRWSSCSGFEWFWRSKLSLIWVPAWK